MRLLLKAVIALCLLSSGVFAQRSGPDTRPTFEAASLKPNRGSGGTRGTSVGGRIGRFPPKPWTGTNVAMPELAQFLSTRLGKPVAHATNLAGGYTFTLTWTPGDGERSGFPGLPPGVSPPVPADLQDGPSLATALQEQLGLRLERRRVPADVLVIDSAQRPAEN